ncbi:MAG: hypothetical protein L6Q95_14085, partial [Planctomycetes bacterium]|nr:hypothetical protein [Planctomycetota bacterium]
MRDELEVHREWLGLLQPVGVVVSPTALASLGFVPERGVVDLQRRLNEVRAPGPPREYVPDLVRLLVHVLDWKEGDLRGSNRREPVPDDLSVVLPNYGETLRPTWSIHDPMEPSRALLLVREVARGA